MSLAIQLDTGYSQFPSIYFGHEHIGGLDDLISYVGCSESMQKVTAQNGVQSTGTTSESADEG